MSENRPVYIPCALDHQAQSEVLLVRRGRLVCLIGPKTLDFTPDDAARLGQQLLELARQCGWKDPEIDDGK
jgi:hypothetical protein